MRVTMPRSRGLAGAVGVGVLWAAGALAWGLPFGTSTGNRVAPGKGTFPRGHAAALATEAPLRWVVAVPPHHLAAVDRDGTLWIFDVAPATAGAAGSTGPASGALAIAGRYGEVAGSDSPPVALALD